MFAVGDRVICVDNSNWLPECTNSIVPPLVKGREYIIYGITTCPKCGEVRLDVGIVCQGKRLRCYCDHLSEPLNIHYCGAKRFRKVQEKKEYIAVSTNIEIEESILN